ncbi:MAG: hypothetical protein HOY79_04505 [Streptomyces sp.]|nr:hypothetical protein [Streptomyces sp.]NUS15467.1 hypothetical protein [Streptomyces sp.]NUS24075.1 hypothetical protein [Streptomyces sp.]
MSHTKSRKSGPRRWLGAVRWLIAAGLHDRANATTLKAAEDLAARMDYDTGHALFCEAEMVVRTGISRANLYRHMGYLRELGALAYVKRGSRANSLRAKGLKGYAGTATEFAAVIPAVYDHAMGHIIVGTGYEARIIVDLRKRQQAPSHTPEPVDNPPVDNSASEALETPSLTVVKEVGQVQMVGGFTTTAARQRNDSTPNPTPDSSSRKRATILGNTVTATGMQLGDKLARAIRRRVSWVRKDSHDQLRWACADMGEQGWSEDQAVRFVVEVGHGHGAGFAWHPARPHRLIAAGLRADQQRQQDDEQRREALARAIPWEESTAYREQQAARAALAALLDAEDSHTVVVEEPERTDEDRKWARMDWNNWPQVIAHWEEDREDAEDLYGKRLVCFAIDQQARQHRAEYAYI